MHNKTYAYQIKVTSQSTMSHVQIVTGILLILLSNTFCLSSTTKWDPDV